MELRTRIFSEFEGRGITLDPCQHQVIDALLRIIASTENKKDHSIKSHKGMVGCYLWGKPGRGKTMLMDGLFSTFSLPKKRIHFHEFLREINLRLVSHSGKKSGRFNTVAREWIGETRLLCFDEFHVHDVADAIFIGGFLETAVSMGLQIVITSNYAPYALMPDPLLHHRFLPTIRLIETQFSVIQLDGYNDYRYRLTTKGKQLFLDSTDRRVDELIAAMLKKKLPNLNIEAKTIQLSGRPIQAKLEHQKVVWFDFYDICFGFRSHIDYLEIAERWNTVVVSNVFHQQLINSDALQRFIWLVDVLYDRKTTLIISSEQPMEVLLAGKMLGKADLDRTKSRLQEMQSRDI